MSDIVGEPAGDDAEGDTSAQSPSATPNRRQNNTVIEVDDEDDDDDGQSSRRRGSRRSPAHGADPNSNTKLEREVTELKLMVAKLEGQSQVKDLVKMNSDTMGVLLSNQKRAADDKKKEQPEEPIKAVWSGEGEKAEDDNHTLFAWGCRRLFKQPNADPKGYWEKANYNLKVAPNLKDSLYLRHLMPMSLSSKALSWGHDLVATTAIKYYTHSQSSSTAKKRKTELSIEECEETMSQRVVTTGQQWGETSGICEVVEAVHNWGAIRFMVAPWDWSPMLLMRILHDVNYFTTVADDDVAQKVVTEKYVDEFLTTNRRHLMQGKPPLVYSKALTLASDVVRVHSGRHDHLFTKRSVYAANRLAKKYKEEADKARVDVKRLQGDKNSLQARVKVLENSNRYRSPPRRGDRRDRRDNRDHDRQETAEEKEYRLDRAEVCKDWNSSRGCTRTHCNRAHVCNAKSAPGKCCKSTAHKGPQHR